MAQTGTVIFAKNTKQLSDFYAQVLGLTVAESEHSHTVLTDDSTELVIHAIPAAVAKAITIEVPPVKREASALKPVFAVSSLEDIANKIAQLGGGIKDVKKAWEIRGHRVVDGWDPEGNIIQFKQSLS